MSTTTGKSAQTPAEAYQAAFDAMRTALEAVHEELHELPTSYDSYLPESVDKIVEAALDRVFALREPTPVKTQKTVTTADPDAPFIQHTQTVRGAWVASDFFAVEAETAPFSTVGAEIFQQVSALSRLKHPRHRTLWRDVVIDAAKKANDDPRLPTKKWTAIQFLNLVDSALTFVANSTVLDDYVAKQIQQRKETAAFQTEIDNKRMAALTERSIAARRAKKAGVK